MMTSVIDNEIEWSEFLYHTLQESSVGLISDSDPDAVGRRIELDAFG